MTQNESKLDQRIEELLDEVEKENGLPIVLSRYGFHVEVLGGKKYVVASTLDELVTETAKSTGRPIEDVRAQFERPPSGPYCSGDGHGSCWPLQGCRRCEPYYIGNGYWNCACTAD